MNIFYIKQGQPFIIDESEQIILNNLIVKLGITTADGFYLADNLCELPPKKVGIIKLPSRTIIIKPRHQEIELSHVIRMYYFINNSSSLNNPEYPEYSLSDYSFNFDFASQYVKELREVIKRGLYSSYISINTNSMYITGKLNHEKTLLNRHQYKTKPINSEVEIITTQNYINKLLSGALLKIKSSISDSDFVFLHKNLPKCSIAEAENYVNAVTLNRHNLYYKKAVDLATIIIKNLCCTDIGSGITGEGFLIDYDALFENFVKDVLIFYSGDSNFSSLSEDIRYGEIDYNTWRGYRPDILYKFTRDHPPKAVGVIDVKNKFSSVFSNQDIYQICFYGRGLKARKLILIYPSTQDVSSKKLNILIDDLSISEIYAVYINIAGNTSANFAGSLRFFCQNILEIIHS
jgi:5-methylcytosine-specific restriction enzyme subunit McrC